MRRRLSSALNKKRLMKVKKRCAGMVVAAFLLLNATAASAQTALPERPNTQSKQEKQSVYKALRKQSDKPVEEVIALYHALKRDAPEEYNFENEQELNRLGYDLLAEERTLAAIAVFELLVSEFPDRANPYDSLGEAYQKAGQDSAAIANYEMSVALNPQNHHATDQLTILKGLELLVTDWGKEFFHFPLPFAEGIPYRGVEEAVFPENWINPDSTEFWSYVIAWALENKQGVTAEELEENLKLYFDGLIGGLSRTDQTKLTKTSAEFKPDTDPTDGTAYTGSLTIFDGFATQEPLTLNARIYTTYCAEKDQLILLFRFSPQAYDHSIWDKLRMVKLRGC
jgi:tetratricopeptide (TPR) repeat protein